MSGTKYVVEPWNGDWVIRKVIWLTPGKCRINTMWRSPAKDPMPRTVFSTKAEALAFVRELIFSQ